MKNLINRTIGGGPEVVVGQNLPTAYITEDLDLTRKGCANMIKHIKNCQKFGVSVIVGINKFTTDSDKEISIVKEEAEKAGADAAVMCDHWAKGGEGAVDVAQAVVKACEKNRAEVLYHS